MTLLDLTAHAVWAEVGRNLWPDPLMKGTSFFAGQGATLANVPGGLEVTRTGTPGRASTLAAQRVAVSPSTQYLITSRRTVGAAVGSGGATDGRIVIVGYDSSGSHRSNSFRVVIGGAPSIGTLTLNQRITTPNWVVSMEISWYSGGNNGDKIVWDQAAITQVGEYFDADSQLPPGYRARWAGTPNASPTILESLTDTGVRIAGQQVDVMRIANTDVWTLA